MNSSRLTANSSRLTAIDVARAVALIGMMATHVLPAGQGGASGAVHDLAGGRSAALFAVLAGVGLALGARLEPRSDPIAGSIPGSSRDLALARARRATVVRAFVIGLIGLALGGLPTPAAIILCYYAALFLLAPLVLGWPARRLAVTAALWAVLSPVVSYWLREHGLGAGPGSNLSFADLAEPGDAARHLLISGYYPVLTWITYLLAGLAVGRLDLRSARVGQWLATGGALLALAGLLIGEFTRRAAGFAIDVDKTFYGTAPTTSWWWLGVRAPHSGGIGDLVHSTGTSLLVIGLAILLVPRAGSLVRPLAAAGSMTLTLYSLHVVALSATPDAFPWLFLTAHVVVALMFATYWGSPARRGPLEELVATAIEVTVPDRRPV